MQQVVNGLWSITEIGSSVNCYLWEWEGGVTLIDTGLPKDAPKILDALVVNGHPLHRLRRIIVTHSDLDHTGGLAEVRQATKARVVCHAVEKNLLEHPNRRKMGSPLIQVPLWLMGRFPGFMPHPVTPDELVVDGDVLPEGFTVVHTPGHTPGHISLLQLERRILITGDALSNRGGKLRAPLPIFTPDGTNAQRSILKLAKKYGDEYETVVFGHGPPILSNGGKRVKALASQIFSTEV
jgi:glyoxylase-like metal-dependent hydrolase (beta-lactamase superfamily II)